jgi:CDP-diacylglycerol---serine O-phosphatidyltransferase
LAAADASTFLRFIERSVVACGVVYVCCAIIRLARFNVENEDDESSHMSFSGLPSPAAAGVVVSLVILQQDFLSKIAARTDLEIIKIIENLIPLALPVATLAAAFLMVTRVRYPHVVNQQFRGKKPFSSFIIALLAVIFIIWNLQLTLVVMFCGFAVWGLLRWVFLKLTGKLNPPTPPSPVPEDPQG